MKKVYDTLDIRNFTFDFRYYMELCSNADATAPAYTIHFVRSWNIKCTVKARQIIFASIIPLRGPGVFPDVPVASLDLWPIKLQFTSVFKFRMQLGHRHLLSFDVEQFVRFVYAMSEKYLDNLISNLISIFIWILKLLKLFNSCDTWKIQLCYWIFGFVPLENTDFEWIKPEKSESSVETCRNWIANWLKFPRIKISDLQDSISPRGGPMPETHGHLFYFSYDELPAKACLCSFCFIFNLKRSRAESCIFCTLLAAGIQALGVFFRGLP